MQPQLVLEKISKTASSKTSSKTLPQLQISSSSPSSSPTPITNKINNKIGASNTPVDKETNATTKINHHQKGSSSSLTPWPRVAIFVAVFFLVFGLIFLSFTLDEETLAKLLLSSNRKSSSSSSPSYSNLPTYSALKNPEDTVEIQRILQQLKLHKLPKNIHRRKLTMDTITTTTTSIGAEQQDDATSRISSSSNDVLSLSRVNSHFCQQYEKPESIFNFPCDRSSFEKSINPKLNQSLLDLRYLPDRLTKLSMMNLVNYYRLGVILSGYPSEVTLFHHTNHKIEPLICLLAMIHTENCDVVKESFETCVLRLGVSNAERILPLSCLNGVFWKNWKEKRLMSMQNRNHNHQRKKTSSSSSTSLNRGIIPSSTVQAAPNETRDFSHRPFTSSSSLATKSPTPYGRPLKCKKSKISLYPIGFGVPETTIVENVSRTVKSFDFCPLLPGKHNSYDRGYRLGTKDEALYRQLYSSSFFSFTNNRGGWVCQRTYEILASGSVPFFPEISFSPKYTHTDLPKDLLRQVMKLSGVQHLGGEFSEYYTPIDMRPEFFLNAKKPNSNDNSNNVNSDYNSTIVINGERSITAPPPTYKGQKNSSSSSSSSPAQKKSTTSKIARFPGPARRSEFMKPISPAHIAFLKPGTIEADKFDVENYYRIADSLLEYTKKYLTCGSVVLSVLERMGLMTKEVEDAILYKKKRVLLVTRFAYDYLNMVIINGFGELGIPLTVVGEPWTEQFVYRMEDVSPLRNFSEAQRGAAFDSRPKVYGKGFSFGARTFRPRVGTNEYIKSKEDPGLLERIAEKGEDNEFVGVIYSYVGNKMLDAPYLHQLIRNKHFFSGKRAEKLMSTWDQTSAKNPDRTLLQNLHESIFKSGIPTMGDNEVSPIAFIDHEDRFFTGVKEYRKIAKVGRMFVREIDEKRSCH